MFCHKSTGRNNIYFLRKICQCFKIIEIHVVMSIGSDRETQNLHSNQSPLHRIKHRPDKILHMLASNFSWHSYSQTLTADRLF